MPAGKVDHAKEAALTVDQLKEIFNYNPDTGIFTWLINQRGPAGRIGQKAGCLNGDGQIRISINCKKYVAHRLAWLYMTGEWPSALVDHINMDRSDNRWENLRLATKSQNMFNRPAPSDNTSGYKGVHKHTQCDRWTAQICVNYKKIYLGLFKTAEEAKAVYDAAAAKLHAEFARTE